MANPNPNHLPPGPGRARTVGNGEISILLDRLLTERGWTIREFADRFGFVYQRVQEYIAGSHKPSAKALTKVLAPFGLRADAIIQIREIGTNRLIQILGDAGSAGAVTGDEPETTGGEIMGSTKAT
jgi:transcriptional regulator with XRE-family HTH domain